MTVHQDLDWEHNAFVGQRGGTLHALYGACTIPQSHDAHRLVHCEGSSVKNTLMQSSMEPTHDCHIEPRRCHGRHKHTCWKDNAVSRKKPWGRWKPKLRHCTWGQKAAYIRRNLPMVERVFKILKLIVISPHDSIKCQSWGGFEKITFYHYKNAHFYTVGQNQLF